MSRTQPAHAFDPASLSQTLQFNCQMLDHNRVTVTSICSAPVCSFPSRFCCNQCADEEHSRHKKQLIPLEDFINCVSSRLSEQPRINQSWPRQSKQREMLQFIRYNQSTAKSDPELRETKLQVGNTIDKMFKILQDDINSRIEVIKKHLFDYCSSRLSLFLEKFRDFEHAFEDSVGPASLQEDFYLQQIGELPYPAIQQSLDSFFQNIDKTEKLEHTQNNLTACGKNHDYLAGIDFDIKQFDQFRQSVLAHFADASAFLSIVPEQKAQDLNPNPVKNLSWKNVTRQEGVQPKFETINELKLICEDQQVLALINKSIINLYPAQGYPGKQIQAASEENTITALQCWRDNFIILARLDKQIQVVNLQGKLIKQFKLLASGPITQIDVFSSHSLSGNKESVQALCSDEAGNISVLNPFSGEELNRFAIHSTNMVLLPDTEFCLNDALYRDQVSPFLVTMPQGKYVSILNPLSGCQVSRINKIRSFEQELFRSTRLVRAEVIKLTAQERTQFSSKINANQLLLTQNQEELVLWNWRNGEELKRINFWVDHAFISVILVCENENLMNQLLIVSQQRKLLKQNFQDDQKHIYCLPEQIHKIHQISKPPLQRCGSYKDSSVCLAVKTASCMCSFVMMKL